jgi:hypothetical protein
MHDSRGLSKSQDKTRRQGGIAVNDRQTATGGPIKRENGE